MKRIIFVSFIRTFGGVERLILSLSKFLHSRGDAHEVVCFRDELGLGGLADWPLTVRQIGGVRRSWSEARELRRFLNDASGSVPLLFDLKGAFYAGLAGLSGFQLHLTDPPSLLSVETSRASGAFRRWSDDSRVPDLRRRTAGNLVHWINRRGARRAAGVIAMTRRIAGELKALYGIEARIIRPGVAEGTVSAAGPRRSGPFRMLSVSRLETSKRLDLAIEALRELAGADGPEGDWVLDVAGAGPARDDLERQAVSLGVSDRVHFHGRVSDERLEQLFHEAGVFVMPAVQGYGLPALEALQRRVPVILHRDSGVSEILEGSPWVVVTDGTGGLAGGLRELRARKVSGMMAESSLPALPLDSEWAAEICDACGWLPQSK